MTQELREAFPNLEADVALGNLEAGLEGTGYAEFAIEPLNSEFVASAVKRRANGFPMRSQALGATRFAAAQQLVKTIKRP